MMLSSYWQMAGIGAIVFASLLVHLLNHRRVQSLQHKGAQNDKIIRALLSYPVHEYTMAHMLERCLAILFAISHQAFGSKGSILLTTPENNDLTLIAARGLDDAATTALEKAAICHYLCLINQNMSQQHVEILRASRDQYGRYWVPLCCHDRLLGLLVLFIGIDVPLDNETERFIKLTADTLAGLIERKSITDDLRLGNSLINHSHQAILLTDQDNRIIRVNPACEKITGYRADELIGQPANMLKSGRHDAQFYQNIQAALSNKGYWQGEIWHQRKNGEIHPEWLSLSPIKDSADRIIQYLAIFTDLTEIKEAQRAIDLLTHYDSLTGLSNRSLLQNYLPNAIAQASGKNCRIGFLCVDIDHFKNINESLGHSSGDELLKIVAELIKATIRNGDTVARLGSDEFAVLISLSQNQGVEQLGRIAQKILGALSKPVNLLGHDIIPKCSIGISLYPDDAKTSDDLVKHAETAMYQAKKQGRHHYQFYTEAMSQKIIERISIESCLNKALKNNEFRIVFQPQIDSAHNRIIGAEALLRWYSKELGEVSPAQFIPIAEETGLIHGIGEWVLHQVCEQVKNWVEQEILEPWFQQIAVNISPVQFKHPYFVDRVAQIIAASKVPVQHLELELTESALQEDDRQVSEKLKALKALGLKIAIDDFGTGYSSLSRLKHFPVDLLKIDQSFVRDISNDPNDAAIVRAIIAMSESLNIRTLAEGVESHNQLNTLINQGCSHYQGFLYSKPVAFSAFEALMIQAQAPLLEI